MRVQNKKKKLNHIWKMLLQYKFNSTKIRLYRMWLYKLIYKTYFYKSDKTKLRNASSIKQQSIALYCTHTVHDVLFRHCIYRWMFKAHCGVSYTLTIQFILVTFLHSSMLLWVLICVCVINQGASARPSSEDWTIWGEWFQFTQIK